MKSVIPLVQILVLIGFLVACAGVVAYQVYFVWPVERCEANGNWWDPKDHVCAVPMPISQFTGRKVDGKLVIEHRAEPAAAPPQKAH